MGPLWFHSSAYPVIDKAPCYIINNNEHAKPPWEQENSYNEAFLDRRQFLLRRKTAFVRRSACDRFLSEKNVFFVITRRQQTNKQIIS